MSKQAYKLHVVERGKGHPVILLHGAMSTHRYWTPVADMLAPNRRLLMPDLLGFGGSPKPRRADYSLDQFVACLEQTFQHHRFSRPPILAGHSMGANIALRWASSRPEKFSGLVLSAPLFFEQSKFYQQMATIPLEGKWLASKALARLVTFAIGLSSFVPFRVANRFARNRPPYVVEDIVSQHFYVYRKLLDNAYFRDDVLAELQKLSLPTRILAGSNDFMTSHAVEDIEKLCKKNTYCQIQVLEGSHQVLLEHPETVARVIQSL